MPSHAVPNVQAPGLNVPWSCISHVYRVISKGYHVVREDSCGTRLHCAPVPTELLWFPLAVWPFEFQISVKASVVVVVGPWAAVKGTGVFRRTSFADGGQRGPYAPPVVPTPPPPTPSYILPPLDCAGTSLGLPGMGRFSQIPLTVSL